MPETTGSGWSFADEEVARTLLSQQYSDHQETDIDKQVHEVMDNGGFYIRSLQDEAQEMIEMACEDWDSKVMGPLPALAQPSVSSPNNRSKSRPARLRSPQCRPSRPPAPAGSSTPRPRDTFPDHDGTGPMRNFRE